MAAGVSHKENPEIDLSTYVPIFENLMTQIHPDDP